MRVCALLLLLLVTLPVLAATDAGQVLFVAGSMTAERSGAPVDLSKNDSVFEQDVIVTAARSRGQLLMRDGAKYALRPETRFAVLEYFMAGDERTQPDGSLVVASQDGAVTQLIKGGFRTITGAIGKDEPEEYELITVAATMGIRGTKYSVVWCDGDCKLPPGIRSKKPILDGLYVGVSEGIVSVTNDTGELLVQAGQYSYVRDRKTPPELLLEKPVPLIDTFPTDVVLEELAAAEVRETFRIASGVPRKYILPPDFPDPPGTDAPNGFPTDPVRPKEADPPIAKAATPVVALSSGPVTGLTTGGLTASSPDGQRAVDGDDLTAMAVPLDGISETFSIGSSSNIDTGVDMVTGFRWGRWSGGAATVAGSDGAAINVDLSAQSLHWVYGPAFESRMAMPITGTAYFSVVAGNTDPTDTLGNSGVLGGASLFANFSTGTVENLLQVFIGESEWQAIGSGRITNELFSGMYDVFVDGQGGGDGSFSGFFSEPAANGLPPGAALTYGLNFDLSGTGQDVSVSGAVVLLPTPTP